MKINRYKKIFYGDNEFQYGHLRIPEKENGSNHPVVILIHGGFWKSQFSLEPMESVAMDLTEQGYATWNIEYRRVGNQGGGYPGTMLDVKKATNFLKTFSEEKRLDLNNIIVVGHSAGGQLALWLAKNQSFQSSLSTAGNDSLTVKGVIALSAITDLKLMWEIDQYIHKIYKDLKKENPVERLLGGNPKSIPKIYKENSPISLLPIGIPQVLVHGDLDLNVPHKFSEIYFTQAKNVNEDIKMITLSNVEHFELIDTESESWLLIRNQISILLNKNLAKEEL